MMIRNPYCFNATEMHPNNIDKYSENKLSSGRFARHIQAGGCDLVGCCKIPLRRSERLKAKFIIYVPFIN